MRYMIAQRTWRGSWLLYSLACSAQVNEGRGTESPSSGTTSVVVKRFVAHKSEWNQLLVGWLNLFNAKFCLRRGTGGDRDPRRWGGGGGGETIPNATGSPPEWLYIKMGNDERHFNVSLTVRRKVTGQCPQITTFEEKREPNPNRGPSAYQPNALATWLNRLPNEWY